MQNRYANSGFSKMSDGTFATLGLTVISAMTDNPNFENPEPSLEEVRTRVADFNNKLASALNGSPLNTSEKNNSRKLLEGELKKLAFYVNNIAQGAIHIILSSGFPVSALAAQREIPEIPERLRLGDTPQSGQLRLDFIAVKAAWEYEYSYTTAVNEDGQPIWGETMSTTSSRNNIISGLIPGNYCYARVRSRNGKGRSDWSGVVRRMAR
ncbi:hypothetical protein GCM10023231_11300 [Olivibacter ginsenosidimutans]|uniref:Fibronectin type III domain-containing protein n=1 Tax=Olivibacter ginsenosidimutans TaxID=1176537 RepID=A0ABP9ASB6_9SPHI